MSVGRQVLLHFGRVLLLGGERHGDVEPVLGELVGDERQVPDDELRALRPIACLLEEHASLVDLAETLDANARREVLGDPDCHVAEGDEVVPLVPLAGVDVTRLDAEDGEGLTLLDVLRPILDLVVDDAREEKEVQGSQPPDVHARAGELHVHVAVEGDV